MERLDFSRGTRFDFSTKKQFSLPFYVVVDGGLVVDVLVDGLGDRGVTVPGQVDGVCRYPL